MQLITGLALFYTILLIGTTLVSAAQQQETCCRAFFDDIHETDSYPLFYEPSEFEIALDGLILIGDVISYLLQDCTCTSSSNLVN